jgi:hypothetical protein
MVLFETSPDVVEVFVVPAEDISQRPLSGTPFGSYTSLFRDFKRRANFLPVDIAPRRTADTST